LYPKFWKRSSALYFCCLPSYFSLFQLIAKSWIYVPLLHINWSFARLMGDVWSLSAHCINCYQFG
jgi:hypothetical protein